MIRPFTCVCFLLACGSGLYLYQAKHRVQMIDREIEKTVRATDGTARADQGAARRMDAAERSAASAGAGRSVPQPEDRHARPVHQHGRSGWPVARGAGAGAPPSEPLTVPIADGSQPEEPAPIPLPPPKPAAVAVAAAPPPRPPEHKPPPRPVIAEAQPVRADADRRASGVGRRAAARRHLPAPASGACTAPMAGSALGMARSTSLPPPRPMPVSASQWVSNARRRLGHERALRPRIPRRAARRPSASARRARTRCRAWRRCGSPSRTCSSAAHWRRRATASSIPRSASVCCSSR